MVNRKTYTSAELNVIWNNAGGKGKQKMLDAYGREMARSAHGDVNSEFCWVVDHKKRIRDGGDNQITNLRPLHIDSDRERG